MHGLAIALYGDEQLDEAGQVLLACPESSAAALAAHIGGPVLIASNPARGAPYYLASGMIGEVVANAPDGPDLRIEQIKLFPRRVLASAALKMPGHPVELTEQEFERAALQAIGLTGLSEYSPFYHAEAPPDEFARQLAQQQGRRCAFSDVPTYTGTAFIIRPLDRGGRWQIGNFLYLDPEPGRLFSAFAWTLGPRLEILIDAYAMGAGSGETVNRAGMLAVSDRTVASLDRNAIAWHRKQFFERLGG